MKIEIPYVNFEGDRSKISYSTLNTKITKVGERRAEPGELRGSYIDIFDREGVIGTIRKNNFSKLLKKLRVSKEQLIGKDVSLLVRNQNELNKIRDFIGFSF